MNPDDTAANRSDARRAQIIAAARDLYEERGLSHTTVKDITERVGVTRTLFYHYFPDKDAVTSAVIDDYTQDYIEALAHWNEERIEGDIDHALSTIVRLPVRRRHLPYRPFLARERRALPRVREPRRGRNDALHHRHDRP